MQARDSLALCATFYFKNLDVGEAWLGAVWMPCKLVDLFSFTRAHMAAQPTNHMPQACRFSTAPGYFQVQMSISRP